VQKERRVDPVRTNPDTEGKDNKLGETKRKRGRGEKGWGEKTAKGDTGIRRGKKENTGEKRSREKLECARRGKGNKDLSIHRHRGKK